MLGIVRPAVLAVPTVLGGLHLLAHAPTWATENEDLMGQVSTVPPFIFMSTQGYPAREHKMLWRTLSLLERPSTSARIFCTSGHKSPIQTL
jgi:hypothetical protein